MQASRNVIIHDEATQAKQGKLNIEKIETDAKDPIQWFGVLVPEPLKECQKEFETAVDIWIPKILNLDGQMRSLEIEIGRTRKRITKMGKSATDIPTT
jgi:hypothetical protein